MYKVRTSDYGQLLRQCYGAKTPLMVYGGPGIGKSEIPRQVFAQVAAEKKLKYSEWSALNKDEKLHAIKNPDEYFIFCDQRISQMDVTDLRGIPSFENKEMLETVPMSWVVYFTQPKAHGIIFFDEINLAAPIVAGSAYQIINDRAISDRTLGEDVYLIAAGNRSQDKAYTHAMPFPLKDRFCELEVTPDITDWTAWASGGNVNPHLIAFLQWKPDYLYKGDSVHKGEDKVSTPRGICRASKLIGDADLSELASSSGKGGTKSSMIHKLVSIAVGEACSTEFLAYVKHFQQLNWNTIYSKPQIVSEFEVDKLWAIAGGIGEQFLRKSTNVELFDNMMEVIEHMQAEFAIVTLRMLRDGNAKSFRAIIKKSKNFKKIASTYGKYVVE